jgi:hypothetical protein
MTAQTLLGRLSTRRLNVSDGMAAHSSCRAVARAVSDVGHWGLEQSRCCNSSHTCPVGFKLGLWVGQSICGTSLSANQPLIDLASWQGALSCWYRQVIITKLVFYHRQQTTCQNVFVSFCVYISMQYYEMAKSILWKTPPHYNATSPDFTVGTAHAGRYHFTGICHI